MVMMPSSSSRRKQGLLQPLSILCLTIALVVCCRTSARGEVSCFAPLIQPHERVDYQRLPTMTAAATTTRFFSSRCCKRVTTARDNVRSRPFKPRHRNSCYEQASRACQSPAHHHCLPPRQPFPGEYEYRQRLLAHDAH